MVRTLVLGVVACALSGCGGSDSGGNENGGGGSVEIASGPLTGKVGGATWTIASAQTDAFLSDEEGFWVDAYAENVATCGAFGNGNHLILSVPKTLGTHRLSLSLNGTFVVEGAETDNLVATQGAIRVDEVTSAIVRGGLTMSFDANNSVSGEFEAVVCPE